jgi:molecular chaperone GrpE
MSHDTDRSDDSKDLDPSGELGVRGTEAETVAPGPDAQLAELTDRHLRLAAEYDNFRRRTAKERGELWAKAQAALLSRIVDALDDLSRFAAVDPARTDANALHDGVNLVERKFWKELEATGVRRMDQVGVVFDPNLHEAVTTAPAATPAQDNTVGAILQAGYKLGDLLIRPARVQVLTWQGDEARGTGEA